jgi:hypothetical protein
MGEAPRKTIDELRALLVGHEDELVLCLDNGGATFDRYTVYYLTANSNTHGDIWYDYVAMSTYPCHPQGFGQHGETVSLPDDSAIGAPIAFHDLPVDCQRVVLNDLRWDLAGEPAYP